MNWSTERMKIACYVLTLVTVIVGARGNNITLENSPQNVTDFKCRSPLWKNITCTWSAPKNSSHIRYSLSYGQTGTRLTFDCVRKLTPTSCAWTSNIGDMYLWTVEKLTFILIGNNGIGNETKQIFDINHWSVVVPGKPKRLKVTGQSARDLFVVWKNPMQKKFDPGVCYRVKYKASFQENFMVQDTGIDVTKITLSGLKPYTLYTVHVQARSCAANADLEPDLWSPISTVLHKTTEDIPSSPPQAHPSLFDVTIKDATRTVTVYWKHLNLEERNVKDFHYQVSIVRTSVSRRRRLIMELPRIDVYGDNFKTFSNLEMEYAYLVKIWCANRMGISRNDTRIIIPENTRMPSPPLYVRPVSEGGGKYNLTWQQSLDTVEEYVLVWCQGDRRCEGDLEWMAVNASTKSIVRELDENKVYNFGVSVISSKDGLSSGLEWAPCTAHRNQEFDRLSNVRADPLGPSSIIISWKWTCEAQKAIVDRYEVSVCKKGCQVCGMQCLSCTEKNKQELGDPEAESIVIKNLSPYSSYSYSVNAIYENGDIYQSSLHCVTTLNDAPSDPPLSVLYSNVTNSSMYLSWKAPANPNGIITRYVIHYRDKQSEEITSENVIVDPHDLGPRYEHQLNGLKCFVEYSVMVSACVNLKCSNFSSPLNAKTDVGVPGPMDPPRAEVVNSSHVRVSWKAPQFPNGPIDRYSLHLWKNKMDKLTTLEVVNVTGNSAQIAIDCSPNEQMSGGELHLFSVQAENLLSGQNYLTGPMSNASETKLCFRSPGVDYLLVIGIILGSALALAVAILAVYFTVRWMKQKQDEVNSMRPILPGTLEQPYSLIYKPKQEVHVTAHRRLSKTDQKTVNSRDRDFSEDKSSDHDSFLTSLKHYIYLSDDGSSSDEGDNAKDGDIQTSSFSGLKGEKRSNEVPSCDPSFLNSHLLPTGSYSKFGFLEGEKVEDSPSVDVHNLVNNEPPFAERNLDPDVPHTKFKQELASYTKFGKLLRAKDVIQERKKLPDSSKPSLHELLPYHATPKQVNPYVTLDAALLVGSQKEPNQLLASNVVTSPIIMKSPFQKKYIDASNSFGESYSKLGKGSVLVQEDQTKCNPYLTLQEVKDIEKNDCLSDMIIQKLSCQEPVQIQCKEPLKSA